MLIAFICWQAPPRRFAPPWRFVPCRLDLSHSPCQCKSSPRPVSGSGGTLCDIHLALLQQLFLRLLAGYAPACSLMAAAVCGVVSYLYSTLRSLQLTGYAGCFSSDATDARPLLLPWPITAKPKTLFLK